MRSYKLSILADQDLSEAFDYTNNKFGSVQANTYLLSFNDTVSKICNQPNICTKRPELGENLNAIPHKGHMIFYEIHSAFIYILRILHQSREYSRFF